MPDTSCETKAAHSSTAIFAGVPALTVSYGMGAMALTNQPLATLTSTAAWTSSAIRTATPFLTTGPADLQQVPFSQELEDLMEALLKAFIRVTSARLMERVG